MPITNHDCPHCGVPIHTDGLLDGYHSLGCGKEFPDSWYQEVVNNTESDAHEDTVLSEDCPYCDTTIVAGKGTTMMAELLNHWVEEQPEELDGLLDDFFHDK